MKSPDTELRTLAVATDTALAEKYKAQQRVRHELAGAKDLLRRCCGQQYDRRQQKWSGTLDDALDAGNIRPPYGTRQWENARERMAASEQQLGMLRDEIRGLQEVWEQNGRWSRFFLVTNDNGHIHSHLACRTCHATTEFAWLPELSALGQADAVAGYGEILCTVCFPDAPVAWTCGESRASKEARAERAAKKEAREAARLAKALLPDGAPLVVTRKAGDRWTDELLTVHQAKAWLTDHFESLGWSDGCDPAAVEKVAQALSDKTGESVQTVLEAAKKRAAKRH